MYGQGDLSELGAHSEQGGYPHPENRAGAADEKRARYARDVAGADRSGERRRNGLERGEVIAVILIMKTYRELKQESFG